MPIRLYNTAVKTKQDFKPIKEGHVNMYVCGVTVYDLCHIGHARSAIVFDVLYRYFRARGYTVTFVRNFTDVDDKIINRANEKNEDPFSLAQRYIDAFHEDMGALGVIDADEEPRATEHIQGMLSMIQRLMDKGYAYTDGGDVYYAVEKLKDYGSLSGRRLDEMKAGSRIAVDGRKRHPMDFVLWKGAKPGEPSWESPWGPGRPGWHIECSVMSNHFLGPAFDIHGGGLDLLFPHHENERAQSVAANDSEFANFWVHNGFITAEGEKMSKSLGNFITIRDALKDYPAEVLRLFLVSKHYRSPLDFAKKDVLDIQSGLSRMYRTIQRLDELTGAQSTSLDVSCVNSLPDSSEGFRAEVIRAMDDDMNTASVVALIFERIKELNRRMDECGGNPDSSTLKELSMAREDLMLAGSILGIFTKRPEEFFLETTGPADDAMGEDAINRLIKERLDARAAKNWARADEIRNQLKDMGIILEDKSGVTTWRRES